MNRTTFGTLGRTFALAALGLGCVLVFGTSLSLAETGSETLPQVPDALKVPDDQPLVIKAIAKGMQIYTCKAKPEDANLMAWTLKAPEAELFDPKGQSIGTHYVGPTWESTDRSKVMGKVSAKVDAPQPENIPWLLLKAKSHEGTGIFAQVNWVQRLNTIGGQAPTTGCDRDRLNQDLSVAYTAEYYFYGKEEAEATQPPSPY